jgi:rare lipoprotein A
MIVDGTHAAPSRTKRSAAAGCLASLLVSVLALVAPPVGAATETESPSYQPVGIASWYGSEHQGRRTASGRRFRMEELTAAHPTLPLATRLLVTNLGNGRKVIVTVSDRGPHKGNRVIDLSRAAAERLGMVRQGVARVRIELAS